jgi:hypothetical protein
MDLPMVVVPQAEAAAKLAEYHQAVRRERDAEDEALLAAYRAARKGLPMISMREAIRRGGFFPAGPYQGLPRLAVARADTFKCWAEWDNGWREGPDSVIYYGPDGRRNLGALVGRDTVRVRVEEPPPARQRKSWERASAVVPLIPPGIRPRHGLRRLHLLWEVESWSPEPPRDPALIRHVRGDLWAVLAVWDLTELERLVLAQR